MSFTDYYLQRKKTLDKNNMYPSVMRMETVQNMSSVVEVGS